MTAYNNPEQYAHDWVRQKAPRMPGYDTEGSGTVTSAVDWRGNRFHIGEMVMYCISAGRGQMMAIGEVIKIESTPDTREYWRDALPGEVPDRTYTSLSGEAFASVRETIPYDEVRVLVLTHKTSGRWGNDKRSKPAWVNPMNITAIPQVENA